MKLFKLMDTVFENFDNTVKNYLTKAFNNLGLEYSQTQIFAIIFDGIKGVMQNIMFYIEDALTEQNIFKASRKQSVYSLAKISGYEPFYGSAACGTLLGKLKINNGLPNSQTSKIYINNFTKIINNKTGITYSLYLPTEYYVFDVSKPLLTHEFKIVQGSINKKTYYAEGNNLETIKVNETNLYDINYIRVYVDGELWTRTSTLYDMTENGKEYYLSVGFDNSFDVIFGNGIYGKKLNEAQEVSIEYLVHVGDSGNVSINDNYDFKFNEFCYDTLGNQVDANEYISLSLNSYISGGTNSDDINFIRNCIGSNSRSLVLASPDNFNLFFKRFSFIGYTNCWSESNSMCITATCLQNINNKLEDINNYFNLKESDIILTENQKSMIINTLNNSQKTFAGITLKFQDPIIRNFAFLCYVKSNNVYNNSTIEEDIKKLIAEYFINILTNGQFIPKSDIIKYILDNNENIVSIDIDIISELAEQTYANGYYNKYELKLINNSYEYVTKKVMYEKESNPGLDIYGNISLDSKLEIPHISNGFKYYNDKENNSKDFIYIDAIQIFFI